MIELLTTNLSLVADASAAGSVMQSYIGPLVRTLSALASLACVFFLVSGGINYMTSAGKPENLDHAKRVIRNALLGLIIILAATVITEVLTHAYTSSAVTPSSSLPQLTQIQPQPASNGLVDILIKAVTGLLNNIIQTVATPFLAALSFFTKATPLMADNSTVFNLWLAMVGIADALFVLVIVLLGFHIMSASTFGFDEIEFKHLLPRIALVFMLLNTSIFIIDGIIGLSNALIRAINAAGAPGTVWEVLTKVVEGSGGQGVAGLLMMLVFLIFAVILLVYYVGRLVTLFIGAVLSPIVILIWLIPGFRDFSVTAIKAYIATIFVLFIHVIILLLAASLFAGMVVATPGETLNPLMAMIAGLATIIALLKTQGVMMQFSYASIGPRTARKLGSQFMTGISYLGSKGRAVTNATTSKVSSRKNAVSSKSTSSSSSSKRTTSANYKQPISGNTNNRATQKQNLDKRPPTGTTSEAPRLNKEELKPPKIMEKK